MPPAELDLALETQLVEVLFWAGKVDEALRRADSLAHRATTSGDKVGSSCGRIQATVVRMSLEPEGETAKLNALAEEALPIFEAARADLALYIGYSALGQVAVVRAQLDTGLAAYERAVVHARRAGVRQELRDFQSGARFAASLARHPCWAYLSWLDENEPGHGRTQ